MNTINKQMGLNIEPTQSRLKKGRDKEYMARKTKSRYQDNQLDTPSEKDDVAFVGPGGDSLAPARKKVVRERN